MQYNAKSIRPFIGAKDFEVSRSFYRDMGFKENTISPALSFFETNGIGFYLQDADVKDWIDNTMVFMELEDVERFWEQLITLDLAIKFPQARLVPIRKMDWGKECFVHDPSGILWHFGEFY